MTERSDRLELVRDPEPGLERVPVQLGDFADFRTALLERASRESALRGWSPESGGPAIMLLELWAYVCDVVSFYEQYIVNENLLGCAVEEGSVRGLVALLGYVPRPALAHLADLAVATSRPVRLPRGFAIRSRAVEGGAQTFETTRAFRSGWGDSTSTVLGGRSTEVRFRSTSTLYATDSGFLLERNDRVVVATDEVETVVRIVSVSRQVDASGRRLRRIRLSSEVAFRDPDSVRVFRPTRSARVEQFDGRTAIDGVDRRLDSGDRVIVGDRVGQVTSTSRVIRKVKTGEQRVDEETTPFFADVPYKEVDLDIPVSQGRRIEFGLVEAAEVVVPAREGVTGRDSLVGAKPPEGEDTFSAVLIDRQNEVVETVFEVTGDRVRALDPGSLGRLRAPIEFITQTLEASEGKTHHEVLGHSDGSIGQTFELSKKPLTYLPTPSPHTAHGFASTLEIRVDGIVWHEVPSFYGADAEAQVFVVREDGDVSTVHFGDGVRGSKLARDAVVEASYRFGANGVPLQARQLDKPSNPVDGLDSLFNYKPSYAGARAETFESIRANGARSVLTFGRIVSYDDLVALALRLPGVHSAAVSWRWNEQVQRSVAILYFVGEPGVGPLLREQLRDAKDPGLELVVEPARPRPLKLELSISPAPRHSISDVTDRISERLVGEDGPLTEAGMTPGRDLVRSELFHWIHQVEGVSHIDSVRANNRRWEGPGIAVQPSDWLDITLIVNGKEVAHG